MRICALKMSTGRQTWFDVVRCVQTELFPVLSIKMRECVEERLSKEPSFKLNDFGANAVEDVIERLKTKRTMNNKEIHYLKGLIRRAAEHQQEGQRLVAELLFTANPLALSLALFRPHSDSVDGPTSTSTESKELSPKWRGLTVDLLFDIFGVHKALLFGQQQRREYPRHEFIKNLQNAEEKVFGGNICSPVVPEKDPRFALSFYPLYLVNDSVFDVMAYHYAVSSVLNGMLREWGDAADGLHIRSVVVPAAICSRYDFDVQHQSSIIHLNLFLNDVASPHFPFSR